MMGLPDGPKSFRIGLVVLIQYRLWQTPTEPATQPPSHVAVAITLNALAKASSLKTMGWFWWDFTSGWLGDNISANCSSSWVGNYWYTLFQWHWLMSIGCYFRHLQEISQCHNYNINMTNGNQKNEKNDWKNYKLRVTTEFDDKEMS